MSTSPPPHPTEAAHLSINTALGDNDASGLWNDALKTFSSFLAQLLQPFGVSEVAAGWMGFTLTLAGAVFCTIVSVGIDKKRIYKWPMLILSLGLICFSCQTLVTLYVVDQQTIVGLTFFFVTLMVCFLNVSTPYHMPADVKPPRQFFPTPFKVGDYGDGAAPYTLVELRLLSAIGALKAKPNWWDKINDDTIKRRWHKELVTGFVAYLSEPVTWKYEGAEDAVGKEAIASKWATALLEELKEEAVKRVVRAGDAVYSPGPVVGTWVSDSAISPDMKARLAELMAPLEAPVDYHTGVPRARDFHPGSNEQVVDLVHPSLYPFVYGFSREAAVPEGTETIFSWQTVIGTGEPKPKRTPVIPQRRWGNAAFLSTKFQWLPSEIDVKKAESGEYTAHFRSYINNLHPLQHTELYRTLEVVFAKFLPLFERVLFDLVNPTPRRHEVCMGDGLHGSNPFDGRAQQDEWSDWQNNHVCTVRTDLGPLKKPETQRMPETPVTAPTPFEIGTQRLQVIVKLATIELTPRKPSYDGGAWHVEGMENESIVASGIYYWLSENVGGDGPEGATRLAFRTSVCEPDYEQCDNLGVRVVYGLEDEESLIQPLGSIPTIEGRAMAWPNTLQHQVQPFKLIDATKPGFRKILVFFLVDPTKRIVSTADVPPQQEEWYVRELLAKRPLADKESDNAVAPSHPFFCERDVLEVATSYAWPYSYEKALEVRTELMAERKFFTDSTMKENYERPFSLCEH